MPKEHEYCGECPYYYPHRGGCHGSVNGTPVLNKLVDAEFASWGPIGWGPGEPRFKPYPEYLIVHPEYKGPIAYYGGISQPCLTLALIEYSNTQ